MVYNNAIPTSGEFISTSQSQILANFAALDSIYGEDHQAYSTGTGYHKQVTIPTPLGSDPTESGTAACLYTKAVSGVAQLFFANSDGVQTLTPLTGTQATNGFVLLANGLMLEWGTYTATGTNTPVTFPTPFATNCFCAFVQKVENTTTGYQGVVVTSKTGFTAYGMTSGHTFYWFAIGN